MFPKSYLFFETAICNLFYQIKFTNKKKKKHEPNDTDHKITKAIKNIETMGLFNLKNRAF